MSLQVNVKRLRGTSSVLALSTAAVIGSAMVQPAAAQNAIYGGGSTLVSLAARQVFDCYGVKIDNTVPPLPAGCSTTTHNTILLYAAVGSGNGFRGFISNNPSELFLGSPNTATSGPFPVSKPATPPSFLGASPFNTYPYPRVDFGASDSPLASSLASLTTVSFTTFTPANNWQTTTSISAATFTTATYSVANYGNPIQLPLIEAPVAVAINVNNDSFIWSIQSQSSNPSDPGGAVQLSTAQVCAIFSGTVKDWSDDPTTGTDIVRLNSTGTQVTEKFAASNVTSGSSTPVAYAGSSLPITLVYRSDGSGTSFIITNYLKNNCPQLGNSTNKYAAIFGAANLPSTTFKNLIDNIKTATGTDVLNTTYNGGNPWLGVNGSDNVQATINNDDAHKGRIGYLSNDFAQPYATSTSAPWSASIQNEDQRAAGIDHPDQGTFIAPTPANVDKTFTGLTVPNATSTYADWNLYGQTYTSGSIGGIALTGKSKLGISNVAGAYPIAGTAFMALYSCYNTSTVTTRVSTLKDFLSWYYAADPVGGATIPASILTSNGFSPLNANLRAAAGNVAATINAGGAAGTACASATGAS